MNVVDTDIPDIKIIEPQVFEDERGFFFESFNQKKFEAAIGHTVTFIQDNHSYSKQGVLRGLHYQLPPHAQAKLVRCLVGEVFDVAVDMRRESLTFGKWVGINLSAKNKRQVWIPEGFAHGFYVLSSAADLHYKATDYWYPDQERIIPWNNSYLDITWPITTLPMLSEKDRSNNHSNHGFS